MPRVRAFAALVLMIGGTIGATLGVARSDPSAGKGWQSAFQVDVAWTSVGLVALSAGAVARRSAIRAARTVDVGPSASLLQFQQALDALADQLGGLCDALPDVADEDEMEVRWGAIHPQLDRMVGGPLADAIDNRHAMIDTFGMSAYAHVMGPLAQGERYLNRAWSAAADGYPGETVDYIHRAVPAVEEARRELAALSDRPSSSTGELHHG